MDNTELFALSRKQHCMITGNIAAAHRMNANLLLRSRADNAVSAVDTDLV